MTAGRQPGAAATKNEKPPGEGRLSANQAARLRWALLDLRLLEIDVLTRHRIVLLERELLGRSPGVLLGHVVVAGVGCAHQLDQDRALLGHGPASPPLELRGAHNTVRASSVKRHSRPTAISHCSTWRNLRRPGRAWHARSRPRTA